MMLNIMEGAYYKKINIGDSFTQFKTNKKSATRNKKYNISQLKPSTVKELLLEKLKKYKKEKTRKKKDLQLVSNERSSSQPGTIPSLTTFLEHPNPQKRQNVPIPKTNYNYGRTEQELPNDILHVNQPEYGNLKNGVKPTYRQLHKNKTMRKENPISHLVKVELQKRFRLGRNLTQKKVGVFIKSNEMRRKINDEKDDMQMSNIKTVKKYLKTKNLIKYGSQAPNELLREIYCSSKVCGDIFNINSQSLVHNYMNNNS
jgi:hypothetical protein